MFKKIQNYGLPKNVFEKQIRFVALEAVQNNENSLNQFNDILEGFKEVSLYGWDKMTKENFNRSTIEILKSFDLQKIDDISFQRDLDKNQKIERVLSSFDKLHNFLQRNLEEVEISEEENEYELTLLALLLFLQSYYDNFYLPKIEEIENEVKQVVEKIKNSNSSNKNQDLEKALKEIEERAVKDFESLSIELEKKTFEFVDEAILALGTGKVAEEVKKKIKTIKNSDIKNKTAEIQIVLKEAKEKELIEKKIVEKNKEFWKTEYLSNVIGNLAFFFRQMRESFSQDFRTFENKLEKVKINRNNIKLSVVSEYKALFRNLIYESSKAEYYKAVLPYSLIKDLDINGQTQAILYQIRTVKEWESYAKTTNVVNGFGIHHNSQEFYYPIKTENLEKEKDIAKKQRKEFLKLIK